MPKDCPIKVNAKAGTCIIDEKQLPAVGFGTYPLTGKICEDSVSKAIHTGYRIIDTATYYKNFTAIAQSLKDQNRSDFYLVSKVWHDRQYPKALESDLNHTLEKLETDYLDAYHLHWPNSEIPIDRTLATMERLRQERKIRHLGLSNVTTNHLKKALKYHIPISWVQVEMHPHFSDFKLLKFCHEHSIALQAWRPLNKGRIFEDTLLIELGKKYHKTAGQVALRWILQHKVIALPGSKTKSHIEENMNIFDFSLSEEEMLQIDKKAKTGNRVRVTEDRGMGFTDEFDFLYEECWPTAE